MKISGDSYHEVFTTFAWEIPDNFNIAYECCTRYASSEPDRVAMIEWQPDGNHRTLTYGELDRQSNRLANVLVDSGLCREDRVSIILPQSFETAIAHIAIYKLGGIAVPLARLFAADAIEYRLKRSGARAVLTDVTGAEKIASIRHRLPDLSVLLVTGDVQPKDGVSWEVSCAAASERFDSVGISKNDPALIIFTSGTTGPPKGALHGHRVLAGHIPGVQIHHEFLPQPDDVGWTPADWAWAGGLLNVLLPCLMLGVPVGFGGLERFNPELALQIVSDLKVTNAFIPPTALRLLAGVEHLARHYDLSLRTIGSGGESLGRETYEWAERELGLTINEFYGQTECNLVLSSIKKLGVSKAGAIGKPVPGHRVGVIRPDGSLCAPGERGEVAVMRPDPVMFIGYWEDEKATTEKFVGDWMRTGDQCVVDEDGYFSFVGRDDDIISYAGYRIGPGEIEDCLTSHPAVKLAVAVGKPDKLRTEIIKAYVVLVDGTKESSDLLEGIRQHVKSKMAANIYPREISVVHEIPLTTTGKVIRRTFRELARREFEQDA